MTNFVSWPAGFLGIPWEPYATGPDRFDCWGLVYHCLRVYYGLELDRFAAIKTDDKAGINAVVSEELKTGCWSMVDEPEDGAVVLMSQRSIIHHVGLAVNGKILHTRAGVDVCLESERTLRLQGFKRIEYYVHDRVAKGF
jgi:cell wall-associated NlpC family hydrolase